MFSLLYGSIYASYSWSSCKSFTVLENGDSNMFFAMAFNCILYTYEEQIYSMLLQKLYVSISMLITVWKVWRVPNFQYLSKNLIIEKRVDYQSKAHLM